MGELEVKVTATGKACTRSRGPQRHLHFQPLLLMPIVAPAQCCPSVRGARLTPQGKTPSLGLSPAQPQVLWSRLPVLPTNWVHILCSVICENNSQDGRNALYLGLQHYCRGRTRRGDRGLGAGAAQASVSSPWGAKGPPSRHGSVWLGWALVVSRGAPLLQPPAHGPSAGGLPLSSSRVWSWARHEAQELSQDAQTRLLL